MKIWKISPKLMLYTSKESSEHVKCRFRLKKYDLLLKKWKKLILKKKKFKGGTLWSRNGRKKKFPFFKFSKFFLKNGFNGTWQMLKEAKECLMKPLGWNSCSNVCYRIKKFFLPNWKKQSHYSPPAHSKQSLMSVCLGDTHSGLLRTQKG